MSNRQIEFYDEFHRSKVADIFEQDDGSLYLKYDPNWDGNLLDPSLPLGFEGVLNDWQIAGLMDGLPIKQNPYYKDYCLKWKIPPECNDIMTLLCTLGHRTISSSICRPVNWAPGLWKDLLQKSVS